MTDEERKEATITNLYNKETILPDCVVVTIEDESTNECTILYWKSDDPARVILEPEVPYRKGSKVMMYHEDCTVQIWENTETHAMSIGWWRND